MMDLIKYARRVAFSICKDPEVESIAHECVILGVQSHREDGGRSLKNWIAYRVKLGVWDFMRREMKRGKQKSELWWEQIAEVAEDVELELPISEDDKRILLQKYVLEWPYDVVAKRNGVNQRQIREMLEAAKQRLKEALECEELT